MGSAVRLREDFKAAQLRDLAKAGKCADQTRRLLALAEIYDGRSRTAAARLGGVGLQTVRDWVLAFNAEGPAGLLNGKAPGNPSILNDMRDRASNAHRDLVAGRGRVGQKNKITRRWAKRGTRPTMDNHLHRPSPVGSWVMITRTWYKGNERLACGCPIPALRL